MRSERSDAIDALAARVRAAQLPPPSDRRRIRKQANVSLREMALTLDVDPMTVQRWEQGQVVPTLEHSLAYNALLTALDAAVG